MRVVVHWRYALSDNWYNISRVDSLSGWGEWVDEVYTVYPDGVAVRKATLHSSNPATSFEWHKSIHVMGPGQKTNILKAPIPDAFWGKYKDKNAGLNYAQGAIGLLKENPVAAFISEPIVGCVGQVPLAPGYLQNLYPAILKQGGVCISDEVQTGFGRLGDYYWGYEAQDVIPDIVILGKPMGNGHPVAAVITTDEIADSFNQGVEFFSSFGGNPVSCAIGLAVLDVLEEEGLQQNALDSRGLL